MEKKARKIIRLASHGGWDGGKKGYRKRISRNVSDPKERRGVDVEGEFLLDLLESGEDCDLRR